MKSHRLAQALQTPQLAWPVGDGAYSELLVILQSFAYRVDDF